MSESNALCSPLVESLSPVNLELLSGMLSMCLMFPSDINAGIESVMLRRLR